MDDEFSYPGLTLDEEDPNSRFLDLYNRFSNQFPDIGRFLEPNDPDLLKYQELASSPTGSEDLIKNYVESMPEREQYKPTFGRKMLATLIGAMSGDPARAFSMARSEVERPYSEAVQEWKMEGSNIGSRARLMDAERQRQLQAIKYGLQTKAGTEKSKAQQEFRKLQEARRIADQVAAEEKATKDAADREAQRQWQRNMSEQIFGQRKDMDEWRKQEHVEDDTAREEARKAADAAKAAKAQSLDQINKRLSAFASQQGVDSSKMTALDVAKILAFKKAQANPAFSDLLTEENGTYTINTPKYGADRERILRMYMDRIIQQYLRGEGF